jgi:hypothetical protein
MLDETALRRPVFREGPKVRLADGQEWTFPRPWLRLYPVRGDDGATNVGGGPGYGPGYDDLVDQLIDSAPNDTTGRLALQFAMATHLLEINYQLSDRDLCRLLAIDLADPTCEERWRQINQILLGRPPKPSADGSATP